MGLFDKFRSSFSGNSKKDKLIRELRDQVQATYYSAASNSPTMDFSFAKGGSLNDALKADLNTLRRRIKYELRQNGPAKGIMRTYANACIFTGPTLSIESIDKEWSNQTEIAFNEWAQNCGYTHGEGYGELLHLGVSQFFTCGEYINVFKTDNTAKTKVKLRILQLKPERLGSPYAPTTNNTVYEGVEMDSNGKPAYYYISKNTTITPYNDTFQKEDARNVSHVFYLEEPEQVRGQPWLAPGLPDLHKKRRYDEARVAAAIIAAKFALFLVNKNPQYNLAAEDILPEGVIEINDGAATVLPPSYEVQSFSGSQPTAGATDFRREMMANVGSSMGMAANIANQDSSTSNFASARYDDVGFSLDYKVTRNIIQNRDLNPTTHRFIKEAAAVGEIGTIPPKYRLIWRWPHMNRHTDPLKAANSDNARVSGGIASKTTIWGEHSKDKEEARKDLLDDVMWHRENGLIHPIDGTVSTEIVEEENMDDADNTENVDDVNEMDDVDNTDTGEQNNEQ
jgi:lambda family phage portal protein